MSTQQSINFKVDKDILPTDTMKILLKYGWTLNDNCKGSYLPISDNGDFD